MSKMEEKVRKIISKEHNLHPSNITPQKVERLEEICILLAKKVDELQKQVGGLRSKDLKRTGNLRRG